MSEPCCWRIGAPKTGVLCPECLRQSMRNAILDYVEGGGLVTTVPFGVPVDYLEVASIYHTAGRREKQPRGYDSYEGGFNAHGPKCRCVTCINLKGWSD